MSLIDRLSGRKPNTNGGAPGPVATPTAPEDRATPNASPAPIPTAPERIPSSIGPPL